MRDVDAGLGERRQQAGCVAVAALLTEWRAALASQLACTQTRVALTPALAHLCAVLAVYSRSCGPAADTGAPVAGLYRRGAACTGEVQRPEGVRTDPYDYHYAWAVCGVPAPARVSYERAGLTPAATSCTSSYLVGPSGASSVCGVTPSPKNGGRRDYMFGIWRAATMRATRRTCGEGPVGMSLCPAGRWRMRGVRDRDLGPAYAGARLLPEGQETWATT